MNPRSLTIRLGRRKKAITVDRIVGQPLVVSCGLGTDSIAMLVWLYRNNIRPDLIQFADTGGEKPETYAYIAVLNAWLASIGFPLLTVVKLHSKHASLEDNCLNNRTLPSLAFGGKGCSLKWKVAPMDRELNSWEPAAIAWASGQKVLKLIGYDASPADCRRSKIREDEKYVYAYPLRDAGIRRDECMRMIASVGLPQPGKSACFFCPASKKAELPVLGEKHPELLARALRLEAIAGLRDGYFGSTKGLGRQWNWRAFLRAEHPALFADLSATYDLGPSDEAISAVAEERRAAAVAAEAAMVTDREEAAAAVAALDEALHRADAVIIPVTDEYTVVITRRDQGPEADRIQERLVPVDDGQSAA
jgi:hypothetical protein